MGNLKELFKDVDRSKLEFDEAPPTLSDQKETKKEPQNQSKAERDFKPASGIEENDDFSPVSADELFTWGEEKFKAMTEKKQEGKGGFSNQETEPGKITETVQDFASPEMIDISAQMYVHILEAIWGGVCSWFSGIEGNYDFEKKMRDRYEKITAIYFQAQNVRLTPSHFFALMTLFLLFGSGWKAYKDRKRRLTAESFRKKSAAANGKRSEGEQATLFDIEPIKGERMYFKCEKDEKGRMVYTVDGLTGAYSKKGEREAVPPELIAFLPDFKAKNGRWPLKKEVDAFLKS